MEKKNQAFFFFSTSVTDTVFCQAECMTYSFAANAHLQWRGTFLESKIKMQSGELPVHCLIIFDCFKLIESQTICSIKVCLLLTADYVTDWSCHNEWNSQNVRSLRTGENLAEALNLNAAVDPTSGRGIYNKTESHGNYREQKGVTAILLCEKQQKCHEAAQTPEVTSCHCPHMRTISKTQY